MQHFIRSAVLLVTVSTCFILPASAQDIIRGLAPTWVGFAPALVAGDLGYYEEEGLTVDFKFEDDRANVLAAMERGDIEVDMRTVGEHQGAPRTDETPGTIIGTIDVSVGGDGVIADGTIESVADLKGKIVAIEPNIPARLLLQMELKKAGLSLKDLDLREIATADTIAVFSDKSIAAVGTYEPFMSQSVSVVAERNPKILITSKIVPDLIVDIITARDEDLAANPQKYKKFLRGIYRAVDFFKKDPAKFAELAAPHYGLTPAEVTEIIDTSMTYTTYEEATAYLGTGGQTGTLHKAFADIMDLNLEFGAASIKLDAAREIENSVITGLFDGAKR